MDTPPGIHNVFHANLLKRAAADPFPNQCQDNLRPPAIMVDGEEEWEVKRILKERIKGRQHQVFNEMERVSYPYVGTRGGPGRHRGVPCFWSGGVI